MGDINGWVSKWLDTDLEHSLTTLSKVVKEIAEKLPRGKAEVALALLRTYPPGTVVWLDAKAVSRALSETVLQPKFMEGAHEVAFICCGASIGGDSSILLSCCPRYCHTEPFDVGKSSIYVRRVEFPKGLPKDKVTAITHEGLVALNKVAN